MPKPSLSSYVNDRRQAVRRTTRIGNDMVFRRVVFVVVDANDDRNVVALPRKLPSRIRL